MPITVTRQRIFITLAIVSLAMVEGFVVVGQRRAADALERRRQTLEALLAIGKLNERKDDAEALVHEYVLRGEESLATRAVASLAEISPRVALARRLMGDNPSQVRRLDRLEPTLKAIVDRFTGTIETRRTRGAAAAAQGVAQGNGRRLTDEADLIFNAMEAEEHRLLAERSERAVSDTRAVTLAVQVGGVLTRRRLGRRLDVWRDLSLSVLHDRPDVDVAGILLRVVLGGVREYRA